MVLCPRHQQCHFLPSKTARSAWVIPVAGKREQICTLGSLPLVQSLSRPLVPPPLGTGRCFKVSLNLLFPRRTTPVVVSACLQELVQACFSQHQSCLLFIWHSSVFTEIFNHWNSLHMALAALPSLEFLMVCICSYLSIFLSKCKSH